MLFHDYLALTICTFALLRDDKCPMPMFHLVWGTVILLGCDFWGNVFGIVILISVWFIIFIIVMCAQEQRNSMLPELVFDGKPYLLF